jgi:hypothetical protein
MSFPIPPDYSSYCEALKRASAKWGTNDALSRVKGLLVYRKLIAYASNRSGKVTEYPSDTWADFHNDYLLNDDWYPGRTRNSITVFRTSELDEALPTVEQRREHDRSPQEVQRADPETKRQATQRWY